MMVHHIEELPNSVYIVRSNVGHVLVHSPPETLKAVLSRGLEVPGIILLPLDIDPGVELGSCGFVRQGINYASIEFFLYANFFGKGEKTYILTATAEQADRIRFILKDTFEGPIQFMEANGYTDVSRECQAVSYYPPLDRQPTINDLCEIYTIDELADVPALASLSIDVDHKNGAFVFSEDGESFASVPTLIQGEAVPLTLAPARPVTRRELTLQFIGGSDGFDPSGITTCFLAYLSHDAYTQATLFDTAAYLRQRLGALGLSVGQISEVVISHLHEDHLAGLPELILMGEQRIRLITSDLIFDSLLKVLAAMFNLPEAEIASLIDYYPLNPGQTLTIEDRTFESIYAIHSVPTIAVRVNGLYYSGDMRYDENWFSELVDKGILSSKRRERLITFAEGATVLVQDAGGGAIHTTVTPELLQKLIAKGQRVILAHTNESKLDTERDPLPEQVEIASSGHVTGHGAAIQNVPDIEILETILASTLLSRLPYADRVQLCHQVEHLHYSNGETIISDGDAYNGLTYLVHSGMVQIWAGEKAEQVMVAGRGSLVGERSALVSHQENHRTGMILAQGDVELLALDQTVFQSIAIKLGLPEIFERAQWLWNQLSFKDILWADILSFTLDFKPKQLSPGETLYNQGDVSFECYLLKSGSISIKDGSGDKVSDITTPSTFFGAMNALHNELRKDSAFASEPTEVWVLSAADLQRLHMAHPNISLHLRAPELRQSF